MHTLYMYATNKHVCISSCILPCSGREYLDNVSKHVKLLSGYLVMPNMQLTWCMQHTKLIKVDSN